MRWLPINTDEKTVSDLEQALGLDRIFCQLLVQRGVHSPSEAKAFFTFSWKDLHNPFLMRNMELATARISTAISNGEHILLYGDYDVDGTTSVALMYAFLSGFYGNIDYYLPDRDKEGYGVSLAGVEYARTTETKLIIAMDCGIKSQKAVSLARMYGIDFIICDHHLPDDELPEAIAILDPKRPDCQYPFKDLSGCGIAFKLIQAYALQNNMPDEELFPLLDLVVVSTACDIVSMTGENRTLSHFGLQRINTAPRLGLWALFEKSNKKMPLNISDLVFGFGPLINAAGRLGDARDAVRLLLATDLNHANLFTANLVTRNKTRQEVDKSSMETAHEQYKQLPDFEHRKSIVLYQEDWHKGVIGITASRLVEHYYKPAVILTKSNGRAVGSARSIQGFDLYEALIQCEDLFYSFGGHAHAAGLQMPPENIPAFIERFEALAQKTITDDMKEPFLDICATINLDMITPEFGAMLHRFEPFGPNNRNPVFVARNVVYTGKVQMMANNHVRFSMRHPHSNHILTGVGFGFGAAFDSVKDAPFDVAFNIIQEEWRGEKKWTLQIKDLKKADL